jgi:hypothetical protein
MKKMFLLKLIFILNFVCIFSAAQAQILNPNQGLSVLGNNSVDISKQNLGREQWFSHTQQINKNQKLGFRFEEADRFNLIDRLGIFNLGMKTENAGEFNFLIGFGDEGTLLAKNQYGIDHYKNISKHFSLVSSLIQRNYLDSKVDIVNIGLDIEPNLPFIFVARTFFTRLKFDSASDEIDGFAIMAKAIALLPKDHQAWLYFSSGKEGILRSYPPTADLVESQTYGFGGRIHLNKTLRIVPEVSTQKYSELDLEIRKYGLSLEYLW